MSRPQKLNRRRVALLLWILVAIFYFYLSYGYITVAMNNERFADYLQYVVQLAGNENRPNKEIRQLILNRADEYGLPLRGDQITILGAGRSLSIVVSYDVGINMPLLRRGVYSKHFDHKVMYNPNY
jgi:hypothetical protein